MSGEAVLEVCADLVVTNAVVRDSVIPAGEVTSFAVTDGRFSWVGAGDAAAQAGLIGPGTRVIDAGGRAVIPGLIDAHTHPMLVLTQWHTTLPVTNDVREQLEFLRGVAEATPPAELPFIYAEYAGSAGDWGPGGATAAQIDAYVSDRPVLLQDSSDHAGTVNSKMLELLGVNAETPLQPHPDDPAMRFERGADGVAPNGRVHENAWRIYADRMWERLGWAPPAEMTAELLETFTGFLGERGVVALFDAYATPEMFTAALELERAGRLHMHVHGAPVFNSVSQLEERIAEIAELRVACAESRYVRATAVKLFLDGTNEIGTSSVIAPFSKPGHEHDHGDLRMSVDDLVRSMVLLNDAEIDLHIHVVGDLGFRTALDAVAATKAALGGRWSLQVTLAHAELIDPADIARVVDLGVFINWTCHWTGGYFGCASQEWLGHERFDRMYQFNPILELGGVVSLGSDVVSSYEMHRADPFLGMQIAHTGIEPEVTQESIATPEALGAGAAELTSVPRVQPGFSRDDLLLGYTLSGARQLRVEADLGGIAVGKAASFSILNQDVMTVPADEMRNTRPEAVFCEGRLVSGSV